MAGLACFRIIVLALSFWIEKKVSGTFLLLWLQNFLPPIHFLLLLYHRKEEERGGNTGNDVLAVPLHQGEWVVTLPHCHIGLYTM